MSQELLVREALRRRRVFENLDKHLRVLVETVKKLDSSSEVYFFGSAAEEKHTYSSDIDVLVVTNSKPEIVISELWKNGVEDPFEIHVVNSSLAKSYKKGVELLKLS